MEKIYEDLITILTYVEGHTDELDGITANNVQYIKAIVEGANKHERTEALAG